MKSYAQFVPVISLTLALMGIAYIFVFHDFIVGSIAVGIGAVGLIYLAFVRGRSRKNDDEQV
jgi:hypothetical protein